MVSSAAQKSACPRPRPQPWKIYLCARQLYAARNIRRPDRRLIGFENEKIAIKSHYWPTPGICYLNANSVNDVDFHNSEKNFRFKTVHAQFRSQGWGAVADYDEQSHFTESAPAGSARKLRQSMRCPAENTSPSCAARL